MGFDFGDALIRICRTVIAKSVPAKSVRAELTVVEGLATTCQMISLAGKTVAQLRMSDSGQVDILVTRNGKGRYKMCLAPREGSTELVDALARAIWKRGR